MNALSFLTPKVQTVYLKADCTLRQAIEKLKYHKFKVIPLIDDNGKYVGSLTSTDLFGYFSTCEITDIAQTEKIKLCEIIKSKHYKCCPLNATSSRVASLLITQLFVPLVDDRGIYCGIIERKKVFNYYLNHYEFGISKDETEESAT